MSKRTTTIMAIGGVAAAAAGYWYGVRPRMLRWGATEDEARRTLPGDERVAQPKLQATHAVTIEAPVEQVWPWLVQLGQGRAGFYSYDWIENLMGLDIHNAGRILPEFQGLKAGDKVPLAPEGADVPVVLLEPNRTLVLHADTRTSPEGNLEIARPGEYFNILWSFHLTPLEEKRARLIERWRVDWSPSLQNTAFMRAFLEPGAFVMERKMLLGIKERVETAGRAPDPDAMFKGAEGQTEYLAAYEASLALAQVAIESFDVSTRLGLTHVNVCGPKGAPPLVLLPGYGFSSTMWYPNLAELSRAYRVYALDTIGDAGRSVYTRPIADRQAYAEWLGDVFDALGLQRAHLAGLSYGGFLAINFALSAPDRVQSLILLSPAASFVPLAPEFYVRTFSAVMLPVRRLIYSMAKWMSATPIEQHAQVVEQFALGLKHFRWGNQLFPSVYTDEELQKITMPVLLVLGEHEVIYDPAQVLSRATLRLPDVRARLIAGAGHALNLDQPEVVNALMTQFLRQTESGEEERPAHAIPVGDGAG